MEDESTPRPDGGATRRSGPLRAAELAASAIIAVAFAVVFMLAFGVGLVSCGNDDAARKPATKRGELETVEVAPPPDARVDVERDVKERRRAETFAGVLPGGFPRTLPLPPQASLVDQGRSDGGRWIEVLVPRRPAAVRGAYLQQLRGAGWSASSSGSDAWQLQRGGSGTIQLTLRAQGPSTQLRFTY